ncbi:hypothetical protein BDV24DRAFT_120824 [Aspergillus arachidicola]|uniref:Uncharacterized protein n=1 Tax=Aspergillus arachidicola TaxID=656916 RepID=A0A5N6XSU2_9EURO|nr:hypothetical protein BDV24DRAFT_120824 [Aspergillus arachidicola]
MMYVYRCSIEQTNFQLIRDEMYSELVFPRLALLLDLVAGLSAILCWAFCVSARCGWVGID